MTYKPLLDFKQALIMVLACVSVLFFLNHPAFAYNEKRILLLGLVTFNLFVHVFTANHPCIFFRFNKRTIISLLIIITLGLCSIFQAIKAEYAMLELSLMLSLLLFTLTYGFTNRQSCHQNSTIIFSTLILSGFLYEIRFFSGFLASFFANIPLIWPEPFAGFSNVRFFNQFQVWTIPLFALPAILHPHLSNTLKKTLFAVASCWGILFVATLSRGAFLSSALAILLTWILFRAHSHKLLTRTLLFLIVGCLSYILLFKWLPGIFENKSTSALRPVHEFGNTYDRLFLWNVAIEHIMQQPWLGIGPMHYAYHPGPTHAHPHNSVLQWAAEMGIPSTLLVLYLAFSAMRAWIKKFYRLTAENAHYVSPHLWVGLFCAMLSGMIYSLFSGVFVMPLSQLMFVLLAGWMMGIYFYDIEEKPVKPVYVLAYKAFAGITLIALVYSVLPSLLPRLHNDYAGLASKKYSVIAPRFWQLGGIPHD